MKDQEKILLIRIFQPFAQYRNPFTFYYAQTFPLPPKSTVLGMLQNAIGDWYGNTKNLRDQWDNLKVSIHGGFESIFWNYQQLIKGNVEIRLSGDKPVLINQKLPLYGESKTSQRTPVYQQELFNGHILVFLKGDKNLLDEIKKSLEKPRKVLYLGRSEDLAFIKNVCFIEPSNEKNVSEDLKLSLPTYLRKEDKEYNLFPLDNEKYPTYSVPASVVFRNEGNLVSHKSEINKNTERNPTFVTLIYTGNDYSIFLNKNVNVERFDVGGKTIKIVKPFGWL